MLRKLCLLLLIYSTLTAFLFSASVERQKLENPFPSRENLLKFDFEGNEGVENYEKININLITTEEGDAVYSLFGHTSLEVLDEDGDGFFTDYGFFTFSDGFYLNFALGKLYYNVYSTDAGWRLSSFQAEDRTVHSTPLPLSNAQKKGVIDFLEYNTRPENNTYLYDYYKDNCATRVRDIIDEATGGAFKAWSEKIETGESFRSSSNKRMQAQFLPAFAINYLEGPLIDQSLSRWELMYLPEELKKGVEEFFNVESSIIYQSRTRTPYNGPSLFEGSLLLSLATFILVIIEGRTRNGILHGIFKYTLALEYFLLFVMSLVLLFMMCFTNHEVTYLNENILFLNPIIFLFLKDTISRKRDYRRRGRLSMLFLFIISSLVCLKGLFPDLFIQDNMIHLVFSSALYLANIILSPPRCLQSP